MFLILAQTRGYTHLQLFLFFVYDVLSLKLIVLIFGQNRARAAGQLKTSPRLFHMVGYVHFPKMFRILPYAAPRFPCKRGKETHPG